MNICSGIVSAEGLWEPLMVWGDNFDRSPEVRWYRHDRPKSQNSEVLQVPFGPFVSPRRPREPEVSHRAMLAAHRRRPLSPHQVSVGTNVVEVLAADPREAMHLADPQGFLPEVTVLSCGEEFTVVRYSDCGYDIVCTPTSWHRIGVRPGWAGSRPGDLVMYDARDGKGFALVQGEGLLHPAGFMVPVHGAWCWQDAEGSARWRDVPEPVVVASGLRGSEATDDLRRLVERVLARPEVS